MMATKTKTKTKTTEAPVRADTTGVPMESTSGNEPQGPEDALGPGKTRGDYRGRLGDTAEHFEGGVAQNPRTENIGDTKGLKGGVETTD
jgi:hypothetical protein